MDKKLTELCDELNNYFWRQKISGKFTVADGAIAGLDEILQDGQYYRILGSVFNDGVWQYVSSKPDSSLHDEIFEGSIWSMAVPQAVIDLASDIDEWSKLYAQASSPALSPYNSESFGGYSYSKGGSTTGSASGNPNSWQSVFSARLSKWRRLRNL